jgi:hypothetical protein
MANSDYVNSDRAFIEEWAAAIDMYGQTFSGVTLTVATGLGLPGFPDQHNMYFSTPPTAFAPDCSTLLDMDCTAETAILAYFAAPPVGGANAKATVMAGLIASPGPTKPDGPLSGISVKWLSEKTAAGPSVLKGSPALVSRMLGGLQFAKPFNSSSTPEKDLLSILQNFFTGTRMESTFGKGSTDMNGSEPVANAPINYLQVWDTDLLYAAGWKHCLSALFQPPKSNGTPPGCTPQNMKKHTTPFMGMNATAEDLLGFANYSILLDTAEAVALPPTCCTAEYPFPRNAFMGDPVCVTQDELNEVASDTAAAPSSYSYNYTAPPVSPYTMSIPYGICFPSTRSLEFNVYRQAYMGDYVCVPSSHASHIQNQNANLSSRVQACLRRSPFPRPRHGG